MVTDEFLWQVSAEVKCSAERENLEWAGGAVERGSTGGKEKERSLWSGRNESGSLNIELRDGMKKAGALQHTGKAGNNARAAGRNLGTILAIPDIADAEFSCAARD